MKRLLYALVLVFGMGYAQDMAKDTIQLQEVVVNSLVPPETRTYSTTTDNCKTNERPAGMVQLLTRLHDLPRGKLYAVTLYVNEEWVAPEHRTKLKDTPLQLLVFDVDANGIPGNLLVQKDVEVAADYSGKYRIVINDAGITVPKSRNLYIGFELNSEVSRDDFYVTSACLFNETIPEAQDKYATYFRTATDGTWQKSEAISAIIMDVAVERD